MSKEDGSGLGSGPAGSWMRIRIRLSLLADGKGGGVVANYDDSKSLPVLSLHDISSNNRDLVQMVTRCLERRASIDMSADQITYRH
jgi:hypothetical protein